ncbi:MAG: hypothetical protein HYR95_02885 [Candidatus Colwellbacteria bacterium]|nr:hypothetical protein [Candidatus Colwellbacteria bacterium]
MRSNKGAVTLPVILLISGIVMEIAIAGVVVAAVISNTIFNSRLAAEALVAARAGAQDAIMKVVRNKNFSAAGAGYNLPNIGDRASAQVVVCKDLTTSTVLCDTSSPGLDEITSTGSALTRKKKMRAIIGVDSISGKVNVVSFKEVPL